MILNLISFSSPFSTCPSTTTTKNRRNHAAFIVGAAAADDDVDDDPLFRAALRTAYIRCQQAGTKDPLVIDPYACGLVGHDMSGRDVLEKSSVNIRTLSSCCYSLAVKFIEDNMVKFMGEIDELKQIVLLTDGMDTRPYRMNWPRSTVIYEISPNKIFQRASERLKGMGAKLSRNCLLVHIPLESPDLQATLFNKGFNGNRLGLWILQGLPLPTVARFEDVLSIASSSAMKGSILIGQLDTPFMGIDPGKDKRKQWIENLFVKYGFLVHVVEYDEVAKDMHLSGPFEDCESVLFIAEQLRLSDTQIDLWREHFQRIEDEGDEEGFEEL